MKRRRRRNEKDLRHRQKRKNPPITNAPRLKNGDSSSSSESSISFSDTRRKMATKKIKPSDLARTDRELARRRRALLAEMNGADDTTDDDEEEDAKVGSSPRIKSSPPKHLVSPVSTTSTNSDAGIEGAHVAPAARRTLVVQSSKKTNGRHPSATFGKKKEVEVIDLLSSSSDDEERKKLPRQTQLVSKGDDDSDDEDERTNAPLRQAKGGRLSRKPHQGGKPRKAVDQVDIETGDIIQSFPSISEASRQTGIDPSCISRAANVGRSDKKIAGGFKWKYAGKLRKGGARQSHGGKVVQQLQNAPGGVVINTFSSAVEASRVVGVDASTISRAAAGNSNSAAGFRWRYVSNSSETIRPKARAKKRAVQQIDKVTNSLIQNYDSILEASRETGVDHGSISKAARGKLQSAGGFIWRYKYNNGEYDAHERRDESVRTASHKSKRRLASSDDVTSKSPSPSSDTDSDCDNDQAQDMDKKPAAKRRKQSHPTPEVIEIDDSDDDISDGRLGKNDSSAAPKDHTTTQKRWVQQLNVETGSVLAIFESAEMAAQSHGISNISELQACLSGTRQVCNGFGWRYVTCPNEMSLQEAFGRTRP